MLVPGFGSKQASRKMHRMFVSVFLFFLNLMAMNGTCGIVVISNLSLSSQWWGSRLGVSSDESDVSMPESGSSEPTSSASRLLNWSRKLVTPS